MDKHHAHLAAALVGTLAAAVTTLSFSPAEAATSATSKVTATASDAMPASGQVFRVRGTVSSKGRGIPATISVKTLRGGGWVQLTGASMHTDSTGHYTIRVVLDAQGERQLRVVADPDARAIRTARTALSVSVGMPGDSTCN